MSETSIRFYHPHPAWRWHGLGMLQREISDEVRVHVWHPDLVKVPPGLRRVHDHRFDLSSLVMVGRLIDHAYDVFIGAPNANTKIWAIKHAKIQHAAPPLPNTFADLKNGSAMAAAIQRESPWGAVLKPGAQPTTPGDDPDVDLIGPALAEPTISANRRAGDLYTIPRGDFHQSEPVGLAITIVHRANFAAGVSARVLGDHAHSAIAGQHAAIERDDAVVERVLAEARSALAGNRW